MALQPIHFISETIEAIFENPPLLEKRPGCPDSFLWRGEIIQITELISEWRDFARRGRMAHNMRPANQRKTVRRGSVGVGRFYFRVRVADGRIFDLYYDRTVLNADQRKGFWTLHQELGEN